MLAVLLVSCIAEECPYNGMPQHRTQALMTIEVVKDGAEKEDYVRTARFIVFDNASSGPSLDINELLKLNPEDQDAVTFRTTLKVNCDPDKMLVVIVNEPESMTGFLNDVVSLAELEGMTFRMADAFNSNHTGLRTTGLPMTGVEGRISVTEENNTESKAATVKIPIERAVARVELWLKTDPQASVEITASTNVTLAKSHNQGYLIGPDPIDNFGRMMTVSSPSEAVTWFYPNPSPLILTQTEQFVCAFYTPERTCSAANNQDKLALYIRGLATPEESREGVTVLTSFTSENGSTHPVTEIRRNNIYKVVGHVKTMQFEHTILPWTDANQGTIIDPQYFLRVSQDILDLPEDGNQATIRAETDYDRTDRGFPKGIRTGAVRYYDKSGNPVQPSGSNLYGWLEITPEGAAGSLVRNIRLTVRGSFNDAEKGCYATAEILAGNLTKPIRINR